ncbi:MAG: ABC transporter ATP-binding protein [Rhodospirillaceae bacterium]|nr:ABC transporter ATP-binding protein [Rhodospirillaceae bacterium]
MADADPPPLIDLRGIVKAYPGCIANDHVDLAVGVGEIHALLGENGAGKSTLVKIMAGVVAPDAGEIRWQGHPVAIDGPASARRLGIGLVFQHFTLFESLTVTENMALGTGTQARGDRKALAARISALGERYGLAVDPHRHVHGLAVGERQRVEILRCLLEEPRLIVLDEPTSVLTPQESEALFATLRLLASEGRGILFISHKLDEVRGLCSRATVLRGGRRVGACDPREESAAALARMMVGAEVVPAQRGAARRPGGEMLRLTALSLAPADPHGVPLRGIDLGVRSGEIVGIAGVAGNGQSELLAAIAGERLAPDMAVRIAAVPVGKRASAYRRRLGLAVVPEERLGRGAVAELSLTDNALLTAAGQGLVRRGLVKKEATSGFARRIIDRFGVVAHGVGAEARSLSGGNMQKFILGREMLQKPRLLVAAHPTWGVDVGAASEIHRALLELRDGGGAVLIISEDLDELLAICDRIGAISRGRLSPVIPADENDPTVRQRIGEWMSGLFPGARDAA